MATNNTNTANTPGLVLAGLASRAANPETGRTLGYLATVVLAAERLAAEYGDNTPDWVQVLGNLSTIPNDRVTGLVQATDQEAQRRHKDALDRSERQRHQDELVARQFAGALNVGDRLTFDARKVDGFRYSYRSNVLARADGITGTVVRVTATLAILEAEVAPGEVRTFLFERLPTYGTDTYKPLRTGTEDSTNGGWELGYKYATRAN